MKMKYTLVALFFLCVFTNAEEIIDSCATDIITDIDSTNQYLKIELEEKVLLTLNLYMSLYLV